MGSAKPAIHCKGAFISNDNGDDNKTVKKKGERNRFRYMVIINQNLNKILKSYWLSTVLISALI